MDDMQIKLKEPYLLFLGDAEEPRLAKTATGVLHWASEKCAGQMRLPGCGVDLGILEMTPKQGQHTHGGGTLLIGVANVGGYLPDSWIASLCNALEHGFDIASGLHSRVGDIPILAETASRRGRRIIDVRFPRGPLPVGNGKKRSGKRLLTVGTDCAVGKMFTALQIVSEMKSHGLNADFRATGQTGIFIAGTGISVDAVIADFISGATELLSPSNTPDHWDVIEGQGSLFHPGYAGVSLGLLHGSQPDAMVLCHDATRSRLAFMEEFVVPEIEEVIAQNTQAARLTNRAAEVVGLSVNTSNMGAAAADLYIEELRHRVGLPVCDPVRTGMGAIVDRLI